MYVCEKVVLHPRSDIYWKSSALREAYNCWDVKTTQRRQPYPRCTCVEQGFYVAPKAKIFCRSLQTWAVHPQYTRTHSECHLSPKQTISPRLYALCALCGYHNCNSQESTSISLSIAFVLLVSLIVLNNNHIKLPIHIARMHCSRWTRRLF